MNDIQIVESDDNTGAELEAELLKSLGEILPQSNNTGFVLAARDSSNNLVAGLTASSSYGWLLVKILWVKDNCRGTGLGRTLMNQAEEKALELGCHHIWLDTSNPDAMAFYLSLGYKVFGKIGNTEQQFPPDHNRWFMKKALS